MDRRSASVELPMPEIPDEPIIMDEQLRIQVDEQMGATLRNAVCQKIGLIKELRKKVEKGVKTAKGKKSQKGSSTQKTDPTPSTSAPTPSTSMGKRGRPRKSKSRPKTPAPRRETLPRRCRPTTFSRERESSSPDSRAHSPSASSGAPPPPTSSQPGSSNDSAMMAMMAEFKAYQAVIQEQLKISKEERAALEEKVQKKEEERSKKEETAAAELEEKLKKVKEELEEKLKKEKEKLEEKSKKEKEELEEKSKKEKEEFEEKLKMEKEKFEEKLKKEKEEFEEKLKKEAAEKAEVEEKLRKEEEKRAAYGKRRPKKEIAECDVITLNDEDDAGCSTSSAALASQSTSDEQPVDDSMASEEPPPPGLAPNFQNLVAQQDRSLLSDPFVMPPGLPRPPSGVPPSSRLAFVLQNGNSPAACRQYERSIAPMTSRPSRHGDGREQNQLANPVVEAPRLQHRPQNARAADSRRASSSSSSPSICRKRHAESDSEKYAPPGHRYTTPNTQTSSNGTFQKQSSSRSHAGTSHNSVAQYQNVEERATQPTQMMSDPMSQTLPESNLERLQKLDTEANFIVGEADRITLCIANPETKNLEDRICKGKMIIYQRSDIVPPLANYRLVVIDNNGLNRLCVPLMDNHFVDICEMRTAVYVRNEHSELRGLVFPDRLEALEAFDWLNFVKDRLKESLPGQKPSKRQRSDHGDFRGSIFSMGFKNPFDHAPVPPGRHLTIGTSPNLSWEESPESSSKM